MPRRQSQSPTTTDKGRLLALMLSCLDHASALIRGLQRNLSRMHVGHKSLRRLLCNLYENMENIL